MEKMGAVGGKPVDELEPEPRRQIRQRGRVAHTPISILRLDLPVVLAIRLGRVLPKITQVYM